MLEVNDFSGLVVVVKLPGRSTLVQTSIRSRVESLQWMSSQVGRRNLAGAAEFRAELTHSRVETATTLH